MRILLIFTAILLASITSHSQKVKWQKVNQSGNGMKYELPADWEVDGFGSSSVCDCSGTINTGRLSKNKEIQMVAYPTLSDSALYKGIRTEVWDWKFRENETRTVYQTKTLTFEKTVSTWNGENTRYKMDPDFDVWRFTTAFKNQFYVIYFWADRKILPKNEKLILGILDRFKAVSVKASDSKYW